jgi:hypothetical protein
MYIIILDEGLVIRESDNKVIAPCESAEDIDFIAYIDWVNAGNQPTIYDTRP